MIEPSYDGDTLWIDVEVVGADGEPRDVSSDVYACSARLGASYVAGTVSVVSAAEGRLRAAWTAGALSAGVWVVHVRGTFQDGAVETVLAGEVVVKPAAFAP